MAVTSDRVDATLKAFTRWAGDAPHELSGGPGADAEELRLLLGLLRDHVGVDDPAHLGPGDLRKLLLAAGSKRLRNQGARAQETTAAAKATPL